MNFVYLRPFYKYENIYDFVKRSPGLWVKQTWNALYFNKIDSAYPKDALC